MGLCVVMCASMQSSAEAMYNVRIFTMHEHVHHNMCEVCITAVMHLACLMYHERLCVNLNFIFCSLYPHRHKYMYLYSTCAGLLQGSCSSVVKTSTAKVGGLGFDSQWLPRAA